MRLFFSIFTALLAIGLLISDFSSVYAQDEFTLDEITVTAQKREENQQDVPIAMDVASGDELREMGYSSIDEVFQSMSAVFINEAGDGLRVSIRGISADEKAQGEMKSYSNASPLVAVNTDGVFTFGRKTGANMYDIERVEVLYGPQSTLYSSNSPGGIVNIVTAKPNTEKFEVSGKIDFGSYHNVETEGMVNVPLSDQTALRAAFITSSHEGYLATGSMDSNSRSVRGKILQKTVDDRLKITLTGEYRSDQGKALGGGVDMFVNQDDVDDPWNNSYDRSQVPNDRVRHDFNMHIEWDLGMGLLTMQGSTSKITETATMLGTDMFTGEEYDLGIDNWQREEGAEARLASPAYSNIEWILGATYFKFRQEGNNETLGTPFWIGTKNESKSHAFYGNITYPISDKFSVTGGLRYSDDWNDEAFAGNNAFMGLFEWPEYIHYKDWDHKIGVEYDLDENSMLYADWSTGYRVGSMGGATEPEMLEAYTIGSKNRFLGNKLQVNWSAYYYDYRNKAAECQKTDPETHMGDEGGKTQGDMRMIGADVQADMILSYNDRLNLSISYENAEIDYLFFDYYSPYLVDVSYAGEPPTFTPEWTFTAVYDHNFNLANGGVLTARIDTRFQTKQRVNFMEEGQGSDGTFVSYIGYRDQEAYHLSNVAMIYAHPDGMWTITGYVKNLENYAVKRNLIQGKLQIGPPRTYGIILSARY